jgi:phospholipase/lecithinase/hemolysin
MRTFQRTMAALLALLPLAVGTAFADSDHGYSRIFVFGDSLSDPGNNFAVTGATSHPPFDPLPVASYGVGGHHYLNGRTWIEYLAQEMGLTKWAKPAYRDPAFGNYAYA